MKPNDGREEGCVTVEWKSVIFVMVIAGWLGSSGVNKALSMVLRMWE